MLNNEESAEIIAAHTKKVASQIRKIDAVLDRPKMHNLENSKDHLEYINYSLYKVSILVSSYIFLQQQEKIISDEKISYVLDIIAKVIAIQRSFVPHKKIVLNSKELQENFKIWSDSKGEVLMNIVIKEHYLLYVLGEVVAISTKWKRKITDLQCSATVVAQNYIDFSNLYQKGHIYQATARRTWETVIALCKDGARSCISVYGHNKKEFVWLGKALHLLNLIKRLAKKETDKKIILDAENRIKRVNKQFISDLDLYKTKIKFEELTKFDTI